MNPVRLSDRDPRVAPEDLVAGLVPPPHFAEVAFDTYEPDPAQPSQSDAVMRLTEFGARLSTPERRRRFGKRNSVEVKAGVYLDGGFGVGKTHLLASLWREAPEPKAYGTFVELTNLVGALGFGATVSALESHKLVCIDEFELDDPGDTVLMSTLLGRLADAGVALAATSNTLPDRLGEGRFAADDFLREIQGLSARFDVVRIDGEDYRHRDSSAAAPVLTDDEVGSAAHGSAGVASLDEFAELTAHLARVHPSKYGALLDGIDKVHVLGVRTLQDQAMALRWVVLADRLYDRDIAIAGSGTPWNELFAQDMLSGGYRKKYYRALSRLGALSTME